MVKIEQLQFKYADHQHEHTIHIPDWRIQDREQVFLTGRSGSGKSTLVHLLSGLLKPNSGSIVINGTAMEQLSNRQKNRFRAAQIGLISQQFNLIPYLSVWENISLAHSFQADQSHDLKQEVMAWMDELELDGALLHHTASALSIGQQQRVAIIRAFANKPKLLLADEPTSALDQQAKTRFIELLHAMTEQHNMTLLFISHDGTLKQHFSTNIDMEALNAV